MDNAYTSKISSNNYQEFLSNHYGMEFTEILGNAFLRELNEQNFSPKDHFSILDAGCGNGWLAGLLKKNYPEYLLKACDLGNALLETGKQKYQEVEFTNADITKPLPYEEHSFDLIVSSMVLHDVTNETNTLKNLSSVLKPSGVILTSIVNPYYAYPIGEWKRGVLGILLRKTPELKLNRYYNELKRWGRTSFSWRNGLFSYFTPLSEHVKSINEAGLYLSKLTELDSEKGKTEYSLKYQLHRFPIILLLTLKKLGQ